MTAISVTGYYDSSVPAPSIDNNNKENEGSDYYIEDGSFLRLKTLSLGYTLPKNIQNKLKMQNARVYFPCSEPADSHQLQRR